MLLSNNYIEFSNHIINYSMVSIEIDNILVSVCFAFLETKHLNVIEITFLFSFVERDDKASSHRSNKGEAKYVC